MCICVKGIFPLQNGGMPATSFGEGRLSPQAMHAGTRSPESISGSVSGSPRAWVSHSSPLSLSFSVKRGYLSLEGALTLMMKLLIDNPYK